MRYAYYPGCAAKGSTPELDVATKKVADILGIELVELQEAGCCGAKEIRAVNSRLDINLNARILGLAERQGLDILTVCNTCLLTLAQANNRLRRNPELLEETNVILSKIGLQYRGGVKVKHLLWILIDAIGLDKLKETVVTPLRGLRIAPFYGCHILRPKKDLGFEDPDQPNSLENVIRALSGDPIEYVGRTKCCGFYVLLLNEKLTVSMIGRRLQEAKSVGADCMVTPCPLCHIALDMFQKEAGELLGMKLDLPIFHLPQLIGLAMGLTAKELQLGKHLVSTDSVVRKVFAK
jgi:succinate dehydrogenase / fumarate reductase cytochrome b subunit